jgi:hypothetical protein
MLIHVQNIYIYMCSFFFRSNQNRILKRSKDCVRSDISYLAMDAVEDGALVASAFFKAPAPHSMVPIPSPSSFSSGGGGGGSGGGGGILSESFDGLVSTNDDDDDDDDDDDGDEVVKIIGAREATGYAAPSSLATTASVAHAGVKLKSNVKKGNYLKGGSNSNHNHLIPTSSSSTLGIEKKVSLKSVPSSNKVLHRGTTSASLLSIENDHNLLQADCNWANHHALLTVWPTAAVRDVERLLKDNDMLLGDIFFVKINHCMNILPFACYI